MWVKSLLPSTNVFFKMSQQGRILLSKYVHVQRQVPCLYNHIFLSSTLGTQLLSLSVYCHQLPYLEFCLCSALMHLSGQMPLAELTNTAVTRQQEFYPREKTEVFGVSVTGLQLWTPQFTPVPECLCRAGLRCKHLA